MNCKTKLSLFWENRISFRDFIAGLSRDNLNCYNISNYFSRVNHCSCSEQAESLTDKAVKTEFKLPDTVNDNNGASKNGESSDRR